MSRKTKLRKIVAALDPKLKPDLLLEQFKEDAAKDMSSNLDELIKTVSTKFQELREILVSEFNSRLKELPDFSEEIKSLRTEFEIKLKSLEKEDIQTIQEQVLDMAETDLEEDQKLKEELETKIEEFKKEFLRKLSNLGGGQANRNILVGGNSSTLSRYTDLNIKAGSNVTLTYVNNDVLKTTDLTIAATGGSGSGIVRSVNNVAVDTAAGDTSTTDYVYLCAGTLTLTLPTAVGNSNLYTVKNTGSGIVTIVGTGGETIDGSADLVMPVQFTSVDLVSNTMAWVIT